MGGGAARAAVLVAGWMLAGTLTLASAAEAQERGPGSRPADERFRVLDLMGPGSAIGVSLREVETDTPGASRGAVVEAVRPDGPAARAGLRPGDVIVAFDGEPVRSVRHLARLVHETPSGLAVPVRVQRDGSPVDLTVAPARPRVFAGIEQFGRELREVLPPLRELELDLDLRFRSGRLGVSVQELQPQLAEYFGVREGVLVTSVEPGTPAEKAGLRAGDVITALNGEPVAGSRELIRRLHGLEPGETFQVGIVRDRQELSVSGQLEDRGEAVRPLRHRLPV